MNTFNELLLKLNWKMKETPHEGEKKADFSQRIKRLEKAGREFEDISGEDILTSILEADLRNIQSTLDQTDRHAFTLAVEMILQAKHVYIIGIRSCEPLSDLLGFYLNMMLDNIRLIKTSSASEILEQMVRIDENDVIIGISFPRYSMRVLKALEFANERSAKVITITDSIHSPMNLYSSCNLTAKSEMASIVDSLTAPLSIINALIVALCMQRKEELLSYLKTLDGAWEEYQIYESDEMNPVNDQIEIWHAKKEKEDIHE